MLDDPQSPGDYEALIKLTQERFDQMSKNHQTISVSLTQNPSDVAVQPVNAIAERVGIHASSFVRLAQALGYRGFKELRWLFQKRLATAAPGFEARSKALRAELEGQSHDTPHPERDRAGESVTGAHHLGIRQSWPCHRPGAASGGKRLRDRGSDRGA